MKVYRVTREDTYKQFYHQPLKQVVTKRSLSALLQSAREYARYRIVKIEEAEIGEWRDITSDVFPR